MAKRIKRHPRDLLKEAADMVRQQANIMAAYEEAGVATDLREIARDIERIRLTEDAPNPKRIVMRGNGR